MIVRQVRSCILVKYAWLPRTATTVLLLHFFALICLFNHQWIEISTKTAASRSVLFSHSPERMNEWESAHEKNTEWKKLSWHTIRYMTFGKSMVTANSFSCPLVKLFKTVLRKSQCFEAAQGRVWAARSDWKQSELKLVVSCRINNHYSARQLYFLVTSYANWNIFIANHCSLMSRRSFYTSTP